MVALSQSWATCLSACNLDWGILGLCDDIPLLEITSSGDFCRDAICIDECVHRGELPRARFATLEGFEAAGAGMKLRCFERIKDAGGVHSGLTARVDPRPRTRRNLQR